MSGLLRLMRSKRFPWIPYLLALALILLFALAPIGSVVVATAIAAAFDCHVDEGSVHPCIIHGHDYGQLLYRLGVMGWFMLATIPAGAIALSAWGLVLLVHRGRWKRASLTGS